MDARERHQIEARIDPSLNEEYASESDPTDEQFERLAAFNHVYSLVLTYGAERVTRWVVNAAKFQAHPYEG